MGASSNVETSTANPALLSRRRFTTLIGSVFVALSSGTNYVYSAYAPQLGSRLGISYTQLNIIALAGNVGANVTGPFWGQLADRKGPRPPFIGAFVCLLVGYSGIRYYYDAGHPSPLWISSSSKHGSLDGYGISSVDFLVLVFCSLLKGVGCMGGVAGCMNATAKSFPDRMRATTTGIVISGFGLSAFLFSTIAHAVFPGDTSSFLLVLALGTSISMLVGALVVRPVPLPAPDAARPEEGRADVSPDAILPAGEPSALYARPNTSRTPLLLGSSSEEESRLLRGYDAPGVQFSSSQPVFSQHDAGRRRRSTSTSFRRSASRVIETAQELHGKALLTNSDFWLLFVTFSLLTGTGLMYINNVGSISQALFAKGDEDYDEVEVAKWQSMQVSTISIANCLGRILSGVSADFVKNRLHFPRSYCISVVSAASVLSQIAAAQVEDGRQLWKASALLGLAYGGAYGLFPTMCIEWFGLGHFSENWGFIAVSPMIGGNLFSLAFGLNLDKHVAPRAMLRSGQCFEGRQCYVSSLYMTTGACLLALLLSAYAGWRDKKRMVGRPSTLDLIN